MSASNRAQRLQHTLHLQSAKKTQFKGPVTKWEKKWVTVGHLKLLKWIALKPKKPVTGQAVNRTKDNVTNKAVVEVASTFRTRSKRGSTTESGASLVETEMEMIYLNSLPKTRSNSRRLEKIQKKLQESTAPKEDGSEDQTITTTTTTTDETRSNTLRKKIFISKNASPGTGSTTQSISSPSLSTGNLDTQKDQMSTPRSQNQTGNPQNEDDDDDDDEEDDSKMEDDDDDEDDKMMTASTRVDDDDDDDSDDDQDIQRGKTMDSQMDDDDDDEEGAY